MMIKNIIAVGDIHIRNVRRSEEYQKKLSKFIERCKEIVGDNKSEWRIVVAGDILHNKTDISPEGYLTASWFLRELGKVCSTVVFAGNHDKSDNEQRLDPLTSLFAMGKMDGVTYLDSVSGYVSSCVEDENITWCLYSSFDNMKRPNINAARVENPNNTFVALFHGSLLGSTTDAGYRNENGANTSYFEGVDFGILGHIHKRQCLKNDGVPLVYCGSLIQQDFGENLNGHGFVVWDVENCTFREENLEDDEYGFYTFSINSETDIDDDTEVLLNF